MVTTTRGGWRAGTWRWPLAGLGGGLLWGAVARTWMRYISEDPEFSWSGTLAVIGLAGLAGLALGSVEALRRKGCRGWRRLVALPALLLFASPGMLMLPSALFGALALSGRGGLTVRLLATALAVSPAAPFLVGEGDLPHSLVLSLAWFALLCLGLAAGWLPVALPPVRSSQSRAVATTEQVGTPA